MGTQTQPVFALTPLLTAANLIRTAGQAQPHRHPNNCTTTSNACCVSSKAPVPLSAGTAGAGTGTGATDGQGQGKLPGLSWAHWAPTAAGTALCHFSNSESFSSCSPGEREEVQAGCAKARGTMRNHWHCFVTLKHELLGSTLKSQWPKAQWCLKN